MPVTLPSIEKESPRLVVGFLVGVGEFVFKFPRRPGRLALGIPFLEDRAGVRNCQPESFDQSTRGIERLAMPVIPRLGGRD